MKYLGINIYKNLTWKHHINNVAKKLKKTDAVLSKIRHCDNTKNLKSVKYAIFESDLSMLHWFGHKISHQLRNYIFYETNHSR